MDRLNLVCAAQTGDAKAITSLLAICQADVRRYARRHCHISDIDDAVQESLMIISKKVGALKVAKTFTAWVFTIVKRECHRLSRAMLRAQALSDEAEEVLLARRTDDDLRIDLAAAMESLPAHYLEVLLLRDFEELTIGEIAERLNESSSAIKSRLHRSRELIREYLLGPERGPVMA